VTELVISLFPGIGLLDRAFEARGFCVVRGPDLLWGGDIREFHPPANVFAGIIGGPPCQDFSGLRRSKPTGYGRLMLAEFARCVTEARPEWWLMENVARVPDLVIDGWSHQRLDINQAWFSDCRRLRHVQFGSRSGRLLHVTRQAVTGPHEGAALASDNRDFKTLCRLQGLPEGFDLPGFLMEEKKRAVGNGVPLGLGMALAGAVIEAYQKPVVLQRTLEGELVRSDACDCGCGRQVTGSQEYYDYSCRKRAQRTRERNRVSTTAPESEKGVSLPISWENG
jgi:DNA (cytosine-5)-methyltransferase 1